MTATSADGGCTKFRVAVVGSRRWLGGVAEGVAEEVDGVALEAHLADPDPAWWVNHEFQRFNGQITDIDVQYIHVDTHQVVVCTARTVAGAPSTEVLLAGFFRTY